MRLCALAIAALAALLIAAAPAQGAAPRDGWGFAIADDDWEWDDPGYLPSLGDGFARLGPKAFRFQMIWNAADFPWHMDRARAMIAQARRQGVEQIVVTFKKSVEPDVDPTYGPQPTADGYAEHVDEVVRQLADQVDVWGPANEPNLGETWLPGEAGARLLAEYYLRLEQIVATRDPTAEITSPDFVDRRDLGTIGRYVRPYVNAGGGWGDHVAFHPYWGAHNETTQTTLDLAALAPPGASIWVTEVGAFGRDQGSIEADETMQNDKVWWLADTLAALPQVERIHYYHMRGNPNASWDTGLMNVDASPRIAWHTWCAMARGVSHPDCQPVTPRTAQPPSGPTPPAPAPSPPDPAQAQPPPSAAVAVLPQATTTGAPPTVTTPVPAPAIDRTAPALRVERLANRLAYSEFIDGFALRVRSSEPTTLEVTVTVRSRRHRDGRRHAVVARKRVATVGGMRVVRLEPSRKRLGELRRFVARVTIRATDPAGNDDTVVDRVGVYDAG